MSNLPAHVARRRPANLPARFAADPVNRPVNAPARRLVVDVTPIDWVVVRIRRHFGPELAAVVRVFLICILIAAPAGLFVWVVT